MIIYSMDTEERVFEYQIVGDDLYPVEIEKRWQKIIFPQKFLGMLQN